jgi:hypothetical protein
VKLTVMPAESGPLPPLYGRWMGSLLGGCIPAETNATCDDCAMCNTALAPEGGGSWFNPGVKCCSYLPRLSNFNVGRMLLDRDSDSSPDFASIEKRLNGSAVTPLGMLIPLEYTALYSQFPLRFGQDPNFLCPHYLSDSGRCGIWRYRNSVCATWFCKHGRGSVGKAFWASLQQLLTAIERQLEIWCVKELDPGPDALAALFAPRRDPQPVPPRNSSAYMALWGRWLGDERRFFERCGQLVEKLSWSKVLQLCGQEVQVYAAAAVENYRRLLDEQLPPSLRLGASVNVISLKRDAVELSGYSPMDAVELPRELFESLSMFDGRPTRQAMDDIAEQHGLDLGADLVRGLVDFAILEPTDG